MRSLLDLLNISNINNEPPPSKIKKCTLDINAKKDRRKIHLNMFYAGFN